MKDLLGDDFAPVYIPAYQSHSSPSREAAHSIAPRLPSIRQRVLDYFKANPSGSTDEQLIDALGMSASTVRPRRVDLVDDGILEDSKRYALTRSGCRATVWILKPQSDPAPRSSAAPPS